MSGRLRADAAPLAGATQGDQMSHRPMPAPAPVLLGALLLGGCTLGGQDDPGATASGAAPQSGTRAGTGSAQIGGTVEVLLASAGQESVDLSGELPVLATRSASSSDGDYEVDLNGVAVREELMTVVFTVRVVTLDGAIFSVNRLFDDGQVREGDSITDPSASSTDGVFVLDPAEGTRHLVAYDSQNRCVCSVALASAGLDAGGSSTLTATFAAPPEGTTTVDVVIPTVGAFTGVTLER